jgi:hypothetical protein
MLIIGTLLKSKRPLKVKEIHDYLSFFISAIASFSSFSFGYL